MLVFCLIFILPTCLFSYNGQDWTAFPHKTVAFVNVVEPATPHDFNLNDVTSIGWQDIVWPDYLQDLRDVEPDSTLKFKHPCNWGWGGEGTYSSELNKACFLFFISEPYNLCFLIRTVHKSGSEILRVFLSTPKKFFGLLLTS